MARRRLQQKGNLYEQSGWWKLRWREDQIMADGTLAYRWSKPVWIGPSAGNGRLTEKQAQRFAWDNFLSRLDQNMRTPQSVMTVREFVERKFKPEHVAMLQIGGRVHYGTMLPIVLDGIPEVKHRSRKKFAGVGVDGDTPEGYPKNLKLAGAMRFHPAASGEPSTGPRMNDRRPRIAGSEPARQHQGFAEQHSAADPLSGAVSIPAETKPLTIREIKRVGGIGKLRLRDVTTEDCQRLIGEALSRGYSTQYALHIKNAISAIFTHAESKDWFSGKNPARRVTVPKVVLTRELHSLTFEQLRSLVAALDPMTRAMVVCAALTSMNIAEVLGLRWKFINLSDEWSSINGESLPPGQIAVRYQWKWGRFGPVKASGRPRNVVIPALLAECLKALRMRDKWTGPEDAVFAGKSPTGRPVDEKNIFRRKLRPTGIALGMPWLGWHDLRRSFATLADEVGMSSGERQALMGHRSQTMTQRYTRTPSEQSRKAVELMGEKIREVVN